MGQVARLSPNCFHLLHILFLCAMVQKKGGEGFRFNVFKVSLSGNNLLSLNLIQIKKV